MRCDGEGTNLKFDAKNCSYTGDIRSNRREGRGTCTYADGGKFEGTWVNDARCDGRGSYHSSDGVYFYSGEIRGNKREGHGVCTYTDRSKYDGSWLNDERSGHGTLHSCAPGESFSYTGEFRHDKREGQGTCTYSEGGRYYGWYEGAWLNDKPHGHGKFHSGKLCFYDGQWQSGKMNGEGTFSLADGSKCKCAQWKNDFFDGECAAVRVLPNGEVCCLRYSDYTDPWSGQKMRKKDYIDPTPKFGGRQMRKWEDGVCYKRNWRQVLAESKPEVACSSSAAPVKRANANPHQAAVTKRPRQNVYAAVPSSRVRALGSSMTHAARCAPIISPAIKADPSRAIVLPARLRIRITAAFVGRLMLAFFIAVPRVEEHDSHQLREYSRYADRAAPELARYYFKKLQARLRLLDSSSSPSSSSSSSSSSPPSYSSSSSW